VLQQMNDGPPNETPWDAPISDEDEERDRDLIRSGAFVWGPGHFGGKAPRDRDHIDERLSDSDDEGPDLGAYFAQWNLPAEQQINICRTYANHKASLQKKEKRTKKT